jgi:hypothetical protein
LKTFGFNRIQEKILLEGKKHLFGIKLTENNIKLEKKVSGEKKLFTPFSI